MKRTKTFFAAFALLLSAAFALAGCGETETPPDDTGKTPGDGQQNVVIDDNYRNYYEIFVRSFYDSGDDGIGDLKGVTHQLDYLKEMGFDGIWLMPIMESSTYHGYDVADYYKVERDYGTNEDFKELTTEAHKRGIKVIIDMVINHSSSTNAWFKKATTALKNGETEGENAKYLDYYNFSKSALSGYRPVSGSDGWYYEAQFDTIMPDLNLDSTAVKDEIKNIFDFWLTDMDCDGFRLDAVTSYYTGNVSKNVEFLSWVNETAKSIKEDAYIVGEAWEGTDGQIRSYYNSGCDSFFLFTVSAGNGGVNELKQLLVSPYKNPGEKFENFMLMKQRTFDTGILAPFLGNHDTARAANMLGAEQNIKMGAGILSVMNGCTFVYYGDEIGMTCTDSSNDYTKRVPMKWTEDAMSEGQVYKSPTAGFIVSDTSYSFGSVEYQREDQGSILNYYKQAMGMRLRNPEIARGTIEKVDSVSPYVGAIKKTWNGKSVIILVNLSKEEAYQVKLSDYGNVKVADTLNVFDGSAVKSGVLTLQPYSIAVLR